MNNKANILLFLLLTAGIFLASLSVKAQFYNGSKTDFGKNRVQYDEFEWKYFRFKQFETYFYTGGKELAIYTSKSAGKYIRQFEQQFDFYLDDKIQFIVYNKHSHFKQSNVGITDENSNIGGVNTVVGTKVFVYFDGDHKHLERQIETGLARVFVYQMMYGGGWKDAIKNSTLSEYPEWYIEGFVRYSSLGWDSQTNNRVKDGILTERYRKFTRLEGEEAIIAGHSLWYFITQTYGEEVLTNILYMTKLSRNVETGFLFVLGIPLKTLLEEWRLFYEERYEGSTRNSYLPQEDNKPDVKMKKDRMYQELKVSSEGKIAYVTNKMGQYRVYVYDRETGKRKKIMKEEHKLARLPDYSYPILAWHPTGEILAIIDERKGKLLMHFYEPATKKMVTKPLFRMEKVLDFAYAPDGRRMVFSAVYEGKSDIYIYNIPGNTQEKITDDFYDDLYPRFLNNKQIVFASNRKSDTLDPEETEIDHSRLKNDLFLYTIREKQGRSRKRQVQYMDRITNTPQINEFEPMDVPGGIGYLRKTDDGMIQRYIAKYDSAITTIDTAVNYRYFYDTEQISHYNRNILSHDASIIGGEQAQIVYNDGKYQMYVRDLADAYNKELNKPSRVVIESSTDIREDEFVEPNENAVKLEVWDEVDKNNSNEEGIDIRNYEFNPEIKDEYGITERVVKLKEDEEDMDNAEEFVLPGQRNYNLSFFPSSSIIQLNNSFLNGQYQNFNGGPFVNAGLGGTFIIGITDIFEDYKIFGGFRYAGSLREYSLSFQNLKKRLDKEYLVSYRRNRQNQFNTIFDLKTYRAAYSLRWPFSEITSIRGVVDARADRYIPLSTDLFALQTDIFNDYWSSVKGSYVYDNTINKAVNINYGTKFKIFGEFYRQIGRENANMTVLGGDFRHYQKIHRELIFVNRFATSTSFGKQKLIFYLGSVDEWWRTSDIFDFDQPIDFSQNYRFQTLASNMRGFIQNVRNGNSFAVVNSEIRWPVFKYFIRRPIKSQVVSNFQIIGFGDIGTAWTGPDPYSDENALNNEEVVKNPFFITLKNNSEPIVGGYGFGLRTMLLGYFIRLDWAWGVKDEVVQPRIFYFSLSLDI